MKRKKRSFNFIALLALVLAALLLDGCSLRPGPARTPEGKALFRLGFSGAPDSLNPYAAADKEAEAVFSLLYDTLFSVDAATRECRNSLCREYTVSESASGVGKLWRFELRDDVWWSDREKLTSWDVEFSLQSAKDLSTLYGYPYCELLDTTGIAIEDDTHFAMIVWGEEALVKACLTRVPILPRHIWNELPCMRYDASGIAADPVRARKQIYGVAADSSTMVGSGLYTWAGWNDGVCTLRLNEAYWNGISRAEVVELHFGLEDPAAALDAKQIDACWDMSLNAYRDLSEKEEYLVTAGTDGTFYQLGFNFTDSGSPVHDAAVRQAAEYCTSRDTLLLYAFGGGFSEKGLISPFSRYYSMDQVVFGRPFDIASASTLLQKAGWNDANGDGVREKNGRSLKLTLLCSNETQAWERAANILKVCFSGAGMELQILALPPSSYNQTLAAGDYDLLLTARETYPEPWMPFLYYYWGDGENAYAQPDSRGEFISLGWNDTGYSSAEYDQLYEMLSAAVDPEQLSALSAKAGEYLYDDSAAVTIGFAVDYQACSRVWTGLQPDAGSGLYFTPLTLSEQMRTVFTGKKG